MQPQSGEDAEHGTDVTKQQTSQPPVCGKYENINLNRRAEIALLKATSNCIL